MSETINFNLSSLLPTLNENKKPKRCECIDCKLKLSLVDFRCKCGKYFCIKHRDAVIHNCTFDYKLNNINNLQEKLLAVNGDKLNKI
jgi:hypothetical protein